MEEFQTHYEYVPALDMQCITKYLTQEKVEFVSCIKELEEFMDLMFSRIKWFIFVFLVFAIVFWIVRMKEMTKLGNMAY